MPDETEWITPKLVSLPKDRQRVEFEYDAHIFKGEFIGGVFLADSEDGDVRQRFAPTDVCWRPLPEPPKPTLPDFVDAKLFDGRSYIAIGVDLVRERLASCFAWQHNPPQDGDMRLVVQTYHRLPCGSHQVTNPPME